jgi:hypothetical protein
LILLNVVPIRIPISPYSNILTKIAPKKVEYLASGPNVSTARDSISPDDNETNACEAISGIKRLLKDILKSNDNDIAAMPAAIPQIK